MADYRQLKTSISYPGVAQMVERVVWDHEAAGSKPVTRTRKPAEIIRFQRVFYVNCLSFAKRYSLIIAAQEVNLLFLTYLFDKRRLNIVIFAELQYN